MSSKETETPHAAATPPANQSKLLIILAGSGVFLSLVAVVILVLLFLRPSIADKIEQGNAEIKEALEANGTQLGKKIVGLQDACIDWQAVLKTVSDKPDATFKIIKTEDGLLTLGEVGKTAEGESEPQEQKK